MSISGEIDKENCGVYTQWYIIQQRNEENLAFATTWMDLEGIMLSEISKTEK